MQSENYQSQIKQQIKQYKNTDNMHGQLPDIFQYWQQKYFKPIFSEIFEVNNHFEFYATPFAKRINSLDNNVLSIGSGDSQIEIGVAKSLLKQGVKKFNFYCLELSPLQIERAKKNVSDEGLSQYFSFIEGDFNKWKSSAKIKYVGVMCHHALHHVLNLEGLFQEIKKVLHPQGCFVTIDMIGRNGHMRWPEALDIIDKIWNFIPEDKKYHHLLKRTDTDFTDRDCSTQGFEGIRAQDILPLLVSEFQFESFFAFGNAIDIFTNRGYGANYDADKKEDAAFIDFIQYMNDLLIELGHLKPTRMCAVMTKGKKSVPRIYKNRTPEFCIRKPD